MSFARVNRVSLHFDWRPGEGLPLVLLHEMGGTQHSGDLVLRALPGRAAAAWPCRPPPCWAKGRRR